MFLVTRVKKLNELLFSPKSMVIVDVVVSFGCVFMALFGSYFAYEDYQESEYDEGDADSAVSSDPRRYVPGRGPNFDFTYISSENSNTVY